MASAMALTKRSRDPAGLPSASSSAPAVVALAVVDGVILGDAEDIRLGMVPDPLPHPVGGQAQDIRVGQTTLHVTAFALPVDEREIFGVFLVCILGNEGVEAVHEGIVDHGGAPVLFLQAMVRPVQPVSRGKIAVTHHLGPEHFPVFKAGTCVSSNSGSERVSFWGTTSTPGANQRTPHFSSSKT